MSKNENKKTILIVEDEEIISLALKSTIKSFGYNAFTVESGEAAVRAAMESHEIGLILMDINLGNGMDGAEAARHILALKDIPIVFNISHSEKDMVEKVRGITRYGYVMKNSGIFVLRSSIEMAFALFEAYRRIEETDRRYRNFFNTAPVGIFYSTISGKIIRVNPELASSLGYPSAEDFRKSVNNASAAEIIYECPEERAVLINKAVEAPGKWVEMSASYMRKDGSKCIARLTVRLSQNDPGILEGFFEDITDYRRNNDALIKENDKFKFRNRAFAGEDEAPVREKPEEEFNVEMFRSLFENMTAGCAIYGVSGSGEKGDDYFLKKINRSAVSIQGLGINAEPVKTFAAQFSGIDMSGIIPVLKKVWETGEAGFFPLEVIRENDRLGYYENTVFRITSGDIVIMFHDITKHKLNEEALRTNGERYAAVLGAVEDGLWDWHVDTGSAYFSDRYYEILGYNKNEFPSSYELWLKLIHADDLMAFEKVSGNSIADGSSFHAEFRIRTASGKWKWLLSRGRRIDQDWYGRPLRIAGTISDITERRLAEEKIRQEKEFFLKEVHHRIKNNMNTIRALLILQSRVSKGPAAAEALHDAANRVQSLMVLYDKLYRKENFTVLSVKDYLPALIDEIIYAFPNRETVRVLKNIDECIMDAGILFPLGIIVNELITNAMKYAFTGRDNGVIGVSLLLNRNRAMIIIEDNGAGIPESVNPGKSGFGLQLVYMLAEQIRASIRVERNNGTKFILEFIV